MDQFSEAWRQIKEDNTSVCIGQNSFRKRGSSQNVRDKERERDLPYGSVVGGRNFAVRARQTSRSFRKRYKCQRSCRISTMPLERMAGHCMGHAAPCKMMRADEKILQHCRVSYSGTDQGNEDTVLKWPVKEFRGYSGPAKLAWRQILPRKRRPNKLTQAGRMKQPLVWGTIRLRLSSNEETSSSTLCCYYCIFCQFSSIV